MKVAVPVWDETLKVFKNAGHAPFFAVFTSSGSGVFKTIALEELRQNPRARADHEHECAAEAEHKDCDHASEAHKEEHRVMSEILKDCNVFVCHNACKNTKSIMKEAGINVVISKETMDAKKLALQGIS